MSVFILLSIILLFHLYFILLMICNVWNKDLFNLQLRSFKQGFDVFNI